MMRRRTRREVLHLAVAGTGGFITATVISDVADAASSTTSEADGVLGTLVEGGSSEITVQTRSGKDVVVRAAASSRLGSGADGTVASLSDFVLGDTVVATGEFDESGILTADFVNSLLVERTLRVEDISPARGRDEEQGEKVALAQGILPDNNRSRVDLAQLERGQVIRALTWTHPADGIVYLLAVT